METDDTAQPLQSPEPDLEEALNLLMQLPADRRRVVLRRMRLMAGQETPWLARLVMQAMEALERLVAPRDKE